jgi:thioesterase domain-containing protein
MNRGHPPTEEAVYSAVERAWKETLPSIAFSPAIEWADAGADSLDILHLVLRLESYLNRKVSIDLVTPNMTPVQLTSLLLEKSPKVGEQCESWPIFLIPPILGDEPILSKFRRSLTDEVLIQMVDLPDLGCPISLLSDMAATGRFVASEISRILPHGTILLAGYSFGGCAAYEAAVCLRAQGRQVGFLGLLDPVSPHPWLSSHDPWREPQSATSPRGLGGWLIRFSALFPQKGETFISYLDWLLFVIFVQFKAFSPARRQTLFGRRWLSLGAFLRRRTALLRRLRMLALQRWRPLPIDVPGLLATSEAYIDTGSLVAWPSLCPNLNIVRIPGKHVELFEPKSLAILVPTFLEAVTAVQSTSSAPNQVQPSA